jgi:exodeoxyribonuclease VII large subunit
MAVPVRAELAADLSAFDNRIKQAWARLLDVRRREVANLARAIPSLGDLLAVPRQRLDAASLRLQSGLTSLTRVKRGDYSAVALRLSAGLLSRTVTARRDRLTDMAGRLARAERAGRSQFRQAHGRWAERLTADLITRSITQKRDRLGQAVRLLKSLSYTSVLERGFALVRDASGAPLRSAAVIAAGDRISLEFADGSVAATAGEDGKSKQAPKPAPSQAAGDKPQGQGNLF